MPRVCLLLTIVLYAGALTAAEAFPTGHHDQLVREFHFDLSDLPSASIRAMAVTRNGLVFAATDAGLVLRNRERWLDQLEPTNVTALFAPAREAEAMAGGGDGVWVYANGRWEREPDSPAEVITFAAEPDGTPWALAPSGVWRRADRWQLVHGLHERKMTRPRGLLPLGPQDAFVTTDSGLFALAGKRKYWMGLEVRSGGLLSPDTRGIARFGADHFLLATDKGLNITNGTTGWRAIAGEDGLPILNLTHLAVGRDGTVWLGSDRGVINWSRGRFTYLAGLRWLPDDRVTALATAPDGSVWVGTPGGISHIQHRKLTLEEKGGFYQQTAEGRDRRHGYVTVMHLSGPGVLEGARQEISDNDGLWTSLFIAAQSFRFAVTKSTTAHEQATRSMRALLRLESITGIPGFPARAIVHTSEPEFAGRTIGTNAEWHLSPVEPDWYWKGDTSSDELDGHYFAWYVFHELAASEEERRQVRDTCKRVTDHILDHGFYLVDLDGKPTTWGVWAPEKLNDDPKWWEGRGLNSLEILSHLRVAMHLVGDPRYERAYRELIDRYHYALNTLRAKTSVGHDDQLLFLAYYPLLQLERDPSLRAIFVSSIERTWSVERVEANPLWNFIYGASTGQPCDVEAAVNSLREIPLDLVTWKVENSHRADLAFDPVLAARGIKQLLRPLPWTERYIHKWDANPYLPDGGNGLGEGDPTIWLLPYWMGRHHRLIE